MQSLSRGHAALRGVVAASLGLVFMAWPGITIGTVAVLFAIYAFTDAIVSLTRIKSDWTLGLRALFETCAGIAAIAYPGVTAAIMTVIAGIAIITTGGLELAVFGRLAQAGVKRSGWAIAGGVLAITTGVALVVWPGIGAVTLALVFGAYLTVEGVILLVQAARNQPVLSPVGA
jgi:uncharacterized membrane protein HdeD (DUF308 family)